MLGIAKRFVIAMSVGFLALAGTAHAGTRWSIVDNPLGTSNQLYGVWGSSARDVWAVGAIGVGPAITLHWDGRTWSSVQNPLSSATNAPLYAVWGSSPSDVWAVGGAAGPYGTTMHWDGSAWSSVASGTNFVLAGVWGSSVNDVWAVGHGNGTQWGDEMGVILHWDGTAWSTVATTSTGEGLHAIWGSSATDIWAVGMGPTMLHWDGTSWSRIPGGLGPLFAIWGTGANDVWAVGQWHTECPAPPNPCQNFSTLLRWDGSVWSQVPSGKIWAGNYWGVWGSGSTDVWAVGDGARMLHWDGTVWSSVSAPGTDILNAVWGASAHDVWAVGNSGTILKN